MEEPFMLIKFGSYEHMKDLVEKGIIYLNNIEYYKKIEDIEIADDWENINSVKQTESISLYNYEKQEWEIIASNTQVRFNNEPFGNVFCMYGLSINHFQEKPFFHIVPINITGKFGDTTVLIRYPREFINRINYQPIKLGRPSCESRFVKYYDEKELDGDINVFYKRNIYSPQSEYRLFVENTENEPLIISIGSIEDIARIINNVQMIKYVLGENEYIIDLS